MAQEPPRFSIIVPTYARSKQLSDCLQSLARLDYPRDRFEVIVVDDGSRTTLEKVVQPMRQHLNIMLLSQAHAGPATARNTGAAQARGEFLAFTDDDCAPAQGWLRALAARFTATPDHLIGGQTLNAIPRNLYSTASQVLLDYLYGYYSVVPDKAFFTSNNLALAGELFSELGGFDTTFPLAAGEDRDFCDRCLRRGYRMTFDPEVIVHHAHELTLRTFCRQHFNYGRGAVYFHQARIQRGQEGVKIEPLSFYLNLLRYPFSQTHSRRAFPLAALLVASQKANAAGFFWEKVRRLTRSKTLRNA